MSIAYLSFKDLAVSQKWHLEGTMSILISSLYRKCWRGGEAVSSSHTPKLFSIIAFVYLCHRGKIPASCTTLGAPSEILHIIKVCKLKSHCPNLRSTGCAAQDTKFHHTISSCLTVMSAPSTCIICTTKVKFLKVAPSLSRRPDGNVLFSIGTVICLPS